MDFPHFYDEGSPFFLCVALLDSSIGVDKTFSLLNLVVLKIVLEKVPNMCSVKVAYCYTQGVVAVK